MLRSMRAGAREFFTIPFNESAVKRAILWVGTQRQHVPSAPKTNGRQLVFLGSKGGVGVTTIASNFAVALAEESKKSVLLVDLNLHLGDAAMNLGLEAAYSTLDALDNSFQLDAFLFSNFLVRHASGLSVLAAPIDVPATTATPVGIGRLLALARQQFDYVVVDGGKKIDLKQMQMFDETTTAYLITQVGIPELRNANRLIAQFQGERSPALEIVINRYQPRFLGLTDEQLAKALTRPIRWRVPNDYAAVCEMQNTGVPLLQTSSSIAGVIRQMARAAGGVADIGKASSRGTISRGIRLPWKANPAA